ncbi:NurA domain protein [Candidatus Burarchaeum australiense]|nr:NurA domain protein [Candidatus Burarchaeum australiense]
MDNGGNRAAEGMDGIAERIRSAEDERKKLAAELRASKAQYAHALEKELVYPITLRAPEGSHSAQSGMEPLSRSAGKEGGVCAVDGGLLAQEFHGFDLLLGRAVAVNFVYADGKLASHAYHPSAAPEPLPNALGGLDLREFAWHQSLFRLSTELGTAAEAIAKFKPKFLLLDGSVAPQIADKPTGTSGLRELYDEVIRKYKGLYELAAASKCALVGVIKDSRGKRFLEIASKGNPQMERLSNTADTPFLNHLLQARERTFVFNYVSMPSHDPVIKDLDEWAGRVLAFYLKPSEEDRPLRVEFIEGTADHDEVAGVVAWLCSINSRYAYPAVLIEADMRAALDKREMDRAYRSLFLKAGGSQSMLKLRRDERPFR